MRPKTKLFSSFGFVSLCLGLHLGYLILFPPAVFIGGLPARLCTAAS